MYWFYTFFVSNSWTIYNAKVGSKIINQLIQNMYYPKFFKRLVSSLIIGGQAINYIFRGKISKNDLFEQLMESGPGSLLIVLITGIAAGTVFNIQVASQLTSMGVSSEIGGLLAVGMAREMAPLLTATLMTGKVATAYAAQLGTMKVTEQIEAITMLRTEPIQYLVVPRLLSMIIMSPIPVSYTHLTLPTILLV